MNSGTLETKLKSAVRQHQSGDVDSALKLYAEILHSSPRHPDAWHLSGLAAHQQGDDSQAEALVRYALELSPKNIQFKSNLASILVKRQQYHEAESLCRQVLRIDQNHSSALSHLGSALRETRRAPEALRVLESAVRISPDAGKLCNLGAVLTDLGRGDEAVDALQKSLQLSPNNPQAALNLGAAYRICGDRDAAMLWLKKAERLAPNMAAVYINQANVMLDSGQVQDALITSQKAVSLDASRPTAFSVLGRVLQQMGHWEEALDVHSLAAVLDPEDQRFQSCYLYAVSLSPHLNQADVVRRHTEWGRKLEASTPVLPPRHLQQNESGVLRIGYVSPDFRNHATMRFLMPLLEAHNRKQFHLYFYSEVGNEDATTQRVKQLSDGWCNTCGLADETLAQQIRDDRIDILVDLAGHTAANRLPVFAMKPAAVQVSFLGYPGTTGLTRIDYFLTDAVRTPPSAMATFTETPVLMPHGACCYQSDNAPEVSPLPMLKNGHITLGSTHRLEKISPQTWQVWSTVMKELPDAKLLLLRDVLASESLRQHLVHVAAEAGIDTERLEFCWQLPESYLEIYSTIDIQLDVFPWGSGTIAYECMWMGVPIPSILGDRAACRATASLLHNCGFPELIASNTDAYVKVIANLAKDCQRLAELRTAIRPAMSKTVCDGIRFARDVETAYRTMWNKIIADGEATGGDVL